MKSLRKETGLTAILALRAGDNVVYIVKAKGESLVQLNTWVGKNIPMHCSASGRSILASLPREETVAILNSAKLAPLTPNTVTSVPEFLAKLERFKERGYSEDREEYTLGIQGVGAPIFDHSGLVSSAVSIAGGVSDLKGRKRELVKELLKCSDEISWELGNR